MPNEALLSEPITAPAAPVARVQPVNDAYFGETVCDRYRWMENDKDPDWLPFLEGQQAHTRAVLDALPGREALLTRIRQLSGEMVATARVQRAGGRRFFCGGRLGAKKFKFFVPENRKDRLLVDPTALDTASSHVSLDWWKASPDGKRLVYGLSRDGSENSTVQVMGVENGAVGAGQN